MKYFQDFSKLQIFFFNNMYTAFKMFGDLNASFKCLKALWLFLFL